MANALYVLIVLIAVPVAVMGTFGKPRGNKLDVIRFVFNAILLGSCTLGLTKLWIAPTSTIRSEFMFGAIVEQLPCIVFLLAFGLPGLLYRPSRRRGYAIFTVCFGAIFTWATTAGSISINDDPTKYLQYFLGYFVVTIFILWWAFLISSQKESFEKDLLTS